MPDSFEFPRMLGSVIPLVRVQLCRRRVVCKFVAFAFGWARLCGLSRRRSRLVPRLAAVIGTLNDLPEPAARLRGVNAIGIHGRAFHVVDLPAGEMRPADF